MITASVCNTDAHENGYNKDFCLFHVFSQKEKVSNSIPFVINITRFYTHARIEHTHEIVLSARSTTGIVFGTTTMSKKRKSRKNVEARPTTAKRVKSDDRLLWRLVTGHPDIFDTHVVPKLNGNEVKFFYDVNRESRRAIQRSGFGV